MSDSSIPELQCSHPDGRPRTRLEMDQWLRTEIPKVHWLRIHACRTLNLPKQISWDMREIVLRHWMLDELVRRQLIIGDQLGVNTTTSNDEAELRQFTQRLAAIIQAGQAVSPQHAEGVDMQGYTPPPPPVMGGVPQAPQQGYAPPGPPPPPPGVPMAPPGSYQAGPPTPPGPPQPPQAPYQGPPAGVASPPPPMGPPGYAPAPAGVPIAPPNMTPPGPPAAPQGRRGKRGDTQASPPPGAAPVPPMAAPPGPPGPPVPQGFAPTGYQAPVSPPGGFAPPVAPPAPPAFPQHQVSAAPAPSASVDLSAVTQRLDHLSATVDHLRTENSQLAASNAALFREIKMLSMTNVILLRGLYRKEGNSDVAGFLAELGQPIPQ